ncbi:MAG: DUF4132 domain-containing protein [Nitrospirae bacterium]|nr:MAG: DUF4132 domain-containing protein [Nitrospirota bacterium]
MGNGSDELCPDGYRLSPENPLRDEHHAINAYLSQLATKPPHEWRYNYPVESEMGRVLLSKPPDVKVKFVVALLDRMNYLDSVNEATAYYSTDYQLSMLKAILGSKLPFSEQYLLQMLDGMILQKRQFYAVFLVQKAMVRQIECFLKENKASHELRVRLHDYISVHLDSWEIADARKLAKKIRIMLGDLQEFTIEPGEAWTDLMLADLKAMESTQKTAWQSLIEHAFTIKSCEPSGKWMAEAGKRRSGVGDAAFSPMVLRWFSSVESTKSDTMSEGNADLLKGLIWYCSSIDQADVASVIGNVALALFKKIPGLGPRSAKAGNACIHVLSRLPGLAPVAQLSRLQLKTKYSKVHVLINTALEVAARRAGMTRADLEEIAVPTFGLEGRGVLREDLGEYVAEIRVTPTAGTEFLWLGENGKKQKSVPAAVRENFSEEIASLKRVTRDIENMLSVQRDRIECLFLAQRSWLYPLWRERYLDHPLLGQFTRRLIWHFEAGGKSGLAIMTEDGLQDAEGRSVCWESDNTRVRLWHPVGFDVSTVRQWRVYLEEKQISQPFKQAHRELYIVTDAELATRNYSNRFAAHILRQHQFNALCRQRGWKYQLQGAFDSFNTPIRELPEWDLRAEFWVESVPADDQMSETGIYLYLSTDQVRFVNLHGEPLPLSEIPALAFTEIMRDVDLFVGVCSIGNDPVWRDQGDARIGTNYWQRYSFGDLSAHAETRKEVMTRLLPRFTIADRCHVDGRFFVVRGDLRTYKIHLGSGNILMEPNDQYLCIVTDRSTGRVGAEKVFLPFEGDQMLSIILSKAFLLARDARITDKTILRQIKT